MTKTDRSELHFIHPIVNTDIMVIYRPVGPYLENTVPDIVIMARGAG